MRAEPELAARRPLASRRLPVFRQLASQLGRWGVSPNVISASSILFGVVAGGCFWATAQTDGWERRVCWLGAVTGIQLRLLANLLDGLVAVEGGRGGPTGELWNEAPDRFADAAILIGAGFAAGSAPLAGFGAALAAVFVAYVRALGASVGAGQIFLGPQAKPQRMALLTVTALITAAFPTFSSRLGTEPSPLIFVALWLIILGSILTAARRLARIAQFLRAKGTS